MVVKKFDVYNFCQENNIECSWDFSKKDRDMWTEIYIDGKMVFQFQHSTTVSQFSDVIRLYNDTFDNSDVDKIVGDDFWFIVSNEADFRRFITKHREVFNLN